MNDLSIQGSRAYATAYTANEVKTPPAAPSTTTAVISSQSNSDTVSISAEAKELFQQSSVAAQSLTAETNSGQPAQSTPPTSGTGNTTQSNGLGGRPGG